jgi:hypothetical protein
MTPETRDKLLRLGAKPIIAALGKHGLRNCSVNRLPAEEPFAGEACLTLETVRAGGVLVATALAPPMRERLARRNLAGLVNSRELRGLQVEPGDVILRDRTALVVLPAALAEQIVEEADTALAFEEFTADQVAQGGGVYGLHIPSGDRAKQAFAVWRRLKGR